MRFRRHLSWNSGRGDGLIELPWGGEQHELRQPAQPLTGPVEARPGSRSESLAESGSTTLFYRLKGLMSHPPKVSF